MNASIDIMQAIPFSQLQQAGILSEAAFRLLLACFLGAFVGLEREAKGKSAGVRTNLLICLGAALFALLSIIMAGQANPDKSRIASNIVQGIGFLGAGVILHNRSRVSGLTSAATVWVVAAIGAASGAGLFASAALAAVIVVVALRLVGVLERRANIKTYSMIYEVRGADQQVLVRSVLEAMDEIGERLKCVDSDVIGELQRVSFSLAATSRKHMRLSSALAAKPAVEKLLTFNDPEED